jgi:hypothetical protein
MTALALAVAAAVSLSTVTFTAEAPGGGLEPVGDAAELIRIIQGQDHVFWMSLSGPVTQVAAWGWPVSDGEVELGGGMSITRPDGGQNGTIDLGGQPMTVTFDGGESS